MVAQDWFHRQQNPAVSRVMAELQTFLQVEEQAALKVTEEQPSNMAVQLT